jgi:protein-arginine kinase activator protein McsA
MSDNPTPSKCECCGRFASIRIKHPREEKPDIWICGNCASTHSRAYDFGFEAGSSPRVTMTSHPKHMTERKESCGECRYFVPVENWDNKRGVCKRFPKNEGKFASDYCGEYRPKAYEPGERK